MIEAIIIQFLNENGFIASAEEPIKALDEYIVVEKTGSSELDYIKNAIIAIQSYSTSLYNTALLNERVKETTKRLIEKNEISKVKLNSDYNFTDTSKKKYRYQAVFEITYY